MRPARAPTPGSATPSPGLVVCFLLESPRPAIWTGIGSLGQPSPGQSARSRLDSTGRCVMTLFHGKRGLAVAAASGAVVLIGGAIAIPVLGSGSRLDGSCRRRRPQEEGPQVRLRARV